jgi:transposase InsO family protein
LFTQADLGEVDGCQAITFPAEAWMNTHKNARLTLRRRQELVARLELGVPLKRTAAAFGVSLPTARKWRDRYLVEGVAGLVDRSSRPHDSPSMTPAAAQLAAKVLRWQKWTCAQIARALDISPATASRILRRCGLSRRGRLEPPQVVKRYEHEDVGGMVHVDIKKLGRITYLGHRATGDRRGQRHGTGWEFVHVAIDDHSRVAYVELLPDELTETARGFVRRALAWFRAHGVRVRRILTDNGSCYRSAGFRATCRALRTRHHRTRPYTPRTNGKAERFIQTLLREWAYARPYYTSADRARVLPGWLEHYNCARPHASIGGQPPMSRFPRGNNLMTAHS